jgi:hypothetical protein
MAEERVQRRLAAIMAVPAVVHDSAKLVIKIFAGRRSISRMIDGGSVRFASPRN